jgi:ParB-like nuclease domain
LKIHCKYDELVDPNKLKEHSKNRNKHGQDQIERLAALFEYHGVRHPIICDADNKKTIIAGRGRQLAAIRAGIKEFPVVYQKFDSEEQKYAFIQADNSIALWSELDLHSINVDLADLGPDFNLDMLGIKNFTLDIAEKEFDPDFKEKEEKTKKCPHCGEVL